MIEKKNLILLTLTLMLVSVQFAGPVNAKPGILPQWMFLAYLDLDNDLDTVIEVDGVRTFDAAQVWLEQMAADINPTSYVRTIVFVDRYYNWIDAENGNARTYELRADEIILLKDNGEVDMSSGDTLYDFLSWATRKYSAEKYSLMIFDHGKGWLGCCVDSHKPEPGAAWMSMPVLETAITEAEAVGSFMLDVLAFNACSMQMTEVAFQMRNCAKVVVGSEEAGGFSVPIFILSELTLHPELDAAGLGTLFVVESTINHSRARILSAIDLTLIGQMVSNLNTFGFYLDNYLKDPVYGDQYKAAITDCCASTLEFGLYEVPEGLGYSDLYHFMELCYASTTAGLLPREKPFINSMTLIMGGIESMVIANGINPRLTEEELQMYANAHGVSIWLPYDEPIIFNSAEQDYLLLDLPSESGAPFWLTWLDTYLNG